MQEGWMKYEAQYDLEYATDGSAGFDIQSVEDVEIMPGEVKVISTSLKVELPWYLELQIRSRSGLAANYGVHVLNSPGTIDSDYRGEVKVILRNTSDKPHMIFKGDRIAQGVIAPVLRASLDRRPEGSITADTGRGIMGFGSTGR